MKTRLYAQLSLAFARELKESGFPAPTPAVGQMWFSLKGQEHLICKNHKTGALETYNTDACIFVPFGGEVTDGMVYCPSVQEAADFLNGKFSPEKSTSPIYQYHLKTWGGFYNKQHQDIHQEQEGDHLFPSPDERYEYLEKLKKIEVQLNGGLMSSLAYTMSEGYCCDVRTMLHRVVKFNEQLYYTQLDLGINYPFDAAKLYLDYSWFPGFNDYPLGQNFDYENNDVEVVQEWITGAFTI